MTGWTHDEAVAWAESMVPALAARAHEAENLRELPQATIDDCDAVDAFARHAVRRLAVVDDGRFVGVISLDDLLLDLAEDLRSLTAPLAAEITAPQRDSPLPVAN